MHLPKHSLLFALLLFGGMAILGFFFPKEGITLGTGTLVLHFPSPSHILEDKTPVADISSVLKGIDELDTNFVPVAPAADGIIKNKLSPDSFPSGSDSASLQALRPDEKAANKTKSKVTDEAPSEPLLKTTIQCRSKKALYAFFSGLKHIKSETKSIRILHYGDSQIEGDRMSDYLRLKLQSQFGGKGPGLISIMPLSRSVINRLEWSDNWERYGAYTSRDKRVKHTNFGVLAGFCKFHNNAKPKTPFSTFTASVGIVTTPNGGSSALNFDRICLFYGGAKYKTWCEFYEGPVLMNADSLEAGGFFRVKQFKIVSGSNKHSFKFKAYDSPDVYAMSLEGETGVMVDNIALRGSSGTFFQHINLEQLKQFYEYLNVKLIILQFGGNAMPAIQDASMAVNYGNYLRYQIGLVKKAAPGVSILFIGPSDMNIKVGTEYVTYPLLEKMRDEIRDAVLESGCAFYDLYAAMGGKNSMAQWVKENLAAKDYTHFSPQGARKMAALLYTELMKAYQSYLNTTSGDELQ